MQLFVQPLCTAFPVFPVATKYCAYPCPQPCCFPASTSGMSSKQTSHVYPQQNRVYDMPCAKSQGLSTIFSSADILLIYVNSQCDEAKPSCMYCTHRQKNVCGPPIFMIKLLSVAHCSVIGLQKEFPPGKSRCPQKAQLTGDHLLQDILHLMAQHPRPEIIRYRGVLKSH